MVSMAMASARAVTTFTLSTSVSEWSNGTPLRRVSRRFCRGGRGEGRKERGRKIEEWRVTEDNRMEGEGRSGRQMSMRADKARDERGRKRRVEGRGEI